MGATNKVIRFCKSKSIHLLTVGDIILRQNYIIINTSVCAGWCVPGITQILFLYLKKIEMDDEK